MKRSPFDPGSISPAEVEESKGWLVGGIVLILGLFMLIFAIWGFLAACEWILIRFGG